MLSRTIRFRVFAICLLGAMLLGSAIPTFADEARYVPGEILIKFKDTATDAQRNGLLREMGATLIKDYKYVGISYVQLNGTTVSEALTRYKNHSFVDIFEPNYLIDIELCKYPNDPMFDEQWGLHNTLDPPSVAGIDIRAIHAWDVSTGSKSVVVGVMDTGIDINHQDLKDNIYHNPGEIPGNGIDDDNNTYIDDYNGWNFDDGIPTIVIHEHGSLSASVIGAKGNNGIGVTGVCWDVSIMPLQVCHGNAQSAEKIIEALNYAIMMEVRIINCSLLLGDTGDNLPHAFEQAAAAGIYIVAAAGNENSDIDDFTALYPICLDLDNIIVVTGITDEDDQIFNYGDVRVDLAAPYEATGCNPVDEYVTWTGTSFSAPYVSGVLALMMLKENFDPEFDYKGKLLQTVDHRECLEGRCVTEGSVNAFLAIADPDYTAPATIRKVTVKEVASNWVELEWTATGDDGTDGSASMYEFRRSFSAIRNIKQFEKATIIENRINPQPAGNKETFVIDGLEQGMTYYIAFRALDEWGHYYYYLGEDFSGNVSGITKVKEFTTLGPPEIALEPTTIVADVEKWELNQLPFEIENNGVGTLDYDIVIPAEFPSITCLPTSGSIQSGDSETITLFVGVDNFPCGTNSAYIEVTSNDENNPLVTLPLELTVSGDGNMAIDPSVINYGPVIVGDSKESFVNITNRGCESLPIMSMVFDNPDYSIPTISEVPAETTIPLPLTFTPSSYGEIVGTLSINTFGDDGPETFEIPLSGEGVTPPEMVITPADFGTPVLYAEGIHHEVITIYNNGGYQLDVILGWGGIPPWVLLSTELASIEPGGSLIVNVTFNAQGYCDESLVGTMVIKSNDPDNVEIDYPLSMTVIPASHIVTSTDILDWGDVQFLLKPITKTLDVQNIGCEGYTLTVTDLVSSLPGIFEVVTATPFTIESGGTYEVTVRLLTGVSNGDHHGLLTILSDDPDNPEIVVDLWANIIEPAMPSSNADEEREIVGKAKEPASLDLRAYPNPFNPSTEVMFNLNRAGSVELRIYDVRGALVSSIDKGYCSSGPVSIPWNGTNNRGASVASGIYFYRVLLSGSQLGETKKMILLR